MAEFPAMPLWTDAYLADTGHLTTFEHGAYLLLLMTAWRNSGSLPNDDRKLARFARVTQAQWTRIRPTMLAFFRIEGEQLSQSRLNRELFFIRQQSLRQSNNAKAKYRKTKRPTFPTAQPNGTNGSAPTPIIDKKEHLSDLGSKKAANGTADSAYVWIVTDDPKWSAYRQAYFAEKGKEPPRKAGLGGMGWHFAPLPAEAVH
jgi:uncharacterized protein YdaU (DUF1376 family)